MKLTLKLAAAALMIVGVAHAAPAINLKPTKPACIQVITPAYNPLTGECREFPTPCDVPFGWIKTSGGCSVAKADTGWTKLVENTAK
ncbi:hypothetical protein [Chitinimonas lacunae]|uniref:DUF2282 domain-containing protein n=1 Tax=Chitinimonas lacunae TaxID=1963018 RepID=A0ABV8MNQ0_9NEIS